MNKSTYNIIKKQNGEAFAKRIRQFDNGIFDIDNLSMMLRYAGRNPEPLLEYLESLKQVQIVSTNGESDPFYLLDKAGYDAFVADTLDKQNSISKYFEKDEMLCTFGDAQRYLNYHIVHAVKKDVHKYKRSDFLTPKRTDDYATSVISIQILKRGGFIKICNRYNHTVDNPDNTFYSNPDGIIEGLSSALKNYFNVDFSADRTIQLPDGYFLFNNQILKYYKEVNNTYFGNGFYFKDGQLHLICKDSQLQVDELIVDLKNKEVLNPSASKTALKKLIEVEMLDETLQVENKNGSLILKTAKGELLVVKDNQLKEITLYKTTTLPEKSFYQHPTVQKITAHQVETCLSDCFYDCPLLTTVELNKAKNLGSGCFYNTRCAVNAKELSNKGILFFDTLMFDQKNNKFIAPGYFSSLLINALQKEMFFKEVSYHQEGDIFQILLNKKPYLTFKNNALVEIDYPGKELDDWVFSHLPDVEVFKANQATYSGKNNLSYCPKLKKAELFKLEEVETYNLSHCPLLEDVLSPLLAEMGAFSFSHNPLLKKIELTSLYVINGSNCFSNSGYEIMRMPLLTRAGQRFCSDNPHLKEADVSNLRCLSEYSLSNLDELEELKLSSLQYIEGRTLITDNHLLKKVFLDKLLSLPSGMLKRCPSLEEVYLKTAYRLEYNTLNDQPNLRYVFAPNVTRMDEGVLENCPNLEEVVSSIPQTDRKFVVKKKKHSLAKPDQRERS